MATLRIGTRGSSLARCQAEIVRAKLEELHPDLRFEFVIVQAKADLNPEVLLVALGGGPRA